MSDSTTIARPYAKAVFEYALAENKLAQWSTYLNNLAQVVLNAEVNKFIANPITTIKQHIDLLQNILGTNINDNKSLCSFITLLATNKRLGLLPEILALYEAHRSEQERTMDVDVTSCSDLTSAQQQRLIDALSKRLARKVSLKINIDPSLLGGAIIRAGDLVIDGSVKGKLTKLSSDLAA